MVDTPYVYTEPPVTEPYLHGLLSVAQEVTPDDVHWQYGGIEFESLAAYMSSTYPGGLTDINGSGGAKVLPACMGATRAAAFAIYGGVATGSLGHNENDNAYWTDRARRIVELAGQHSVETAFWTGSAGAKPALNDAATPLILPGQANTAIGAVPLVYAVGKMEKYLTDHYAGRGLIHGTRDMAAPLDAMQQIKTDPNNDAVLETHLGTKLVFGGGYDGTGPGALTPPADANGVTYSWMYATGQVVYMRTDITTPASYGQALDRNKNQVALLAEQAWLGTIDVIKAAILVKTPTFS